jgi:sodium transport system permease protein
MVKIFPFILVMWSLAGALYPAVDLCAGEKERGTMETLLISPAGREEIVWGKFLTIWVFSAATALLNLLSMALTAWRFAAVALPGAAFSPWVLFWGVALLLPLSAFFSAICLAIGAYARSSKEGQYYLMPLFVITMPLIFLTLAPGVELNPFYSMVPVTGVALLLQRLMAAETLDRGLWLYFIPVLAPMVIYSWLALRWAIAQFQREEVLFREAERLDLGLWLRQLWRDKEALPSPGEAFFCFGLILALRWLSLGIGTQLSLLTYTGIAQVAFVAAPPLFMALVLTTRPLRGLALHNPPWWSWPAAILLALLVVPPLALLTLAILRQFPALEALLEQYQPLTRELRALAGRHGLAVRLEFLLVLGVLPALCEELAFRGFILTGLLRAFRPWTAILLSAFLFAVHQMNVFQFAPHFLLGIVLGLLRARSGSVLPAMLFHLVYNLLIIAPALRAAEKGSGGAEAPGIWVVVVAAGCTLLACAGLWAVWYLGRDASANRR